MSCFLYILPRTVLPHTSCLSLLLLTPFHSRSLNSAAVPASKHTHKKITKKPWQKKTSPECSPFPSWFKILNSERTRCPSLSLNCWQLLCIFCATSRCTSNPPRPRQKAGTRTKPITHQYGFGCCNLYVCAAGDDYLAFFFLSVDSGLWNKTGANKIRGQRKHEQNEKSN